LGEAKAAYQSGPAGAPRLGWRQATDQTVTGLGYELVDIERSAKGLLRVFIDRVPGHAYASGEGEFVTVEDCEQVTRQLQYALEVDGVDYSRLEVSSPGLDRPLRREADYTRFVGQDISVTLKAPFQGRKVWKGRLQAGDGGGWVLHFNDGKADQVLAFALEEVREARLVPVLDFKGRRGQQPAAAPLGDEGGSVR
jgi:ribosome maturation factor RimP